MAHLLIDIGSVIGHVIEAIGIAVIVLGFLFAPFVAVVGRRKRSKDRLGEIRKAIKRNMMLGLDFLVAGDIIRTVTVDPSLSKVASLGLLVLIRTALVFTIHLEVEGHWPWQAAPAPGETRPGETA